MQPQAILNMVMPQGLKPPRAHWDGHRQCRGMAMAEMHLRAKFGEALVVDHHTYVIAGDGCLMEAISHEAASMAGHFGLGNMIVLFDDNGISIDGKTELTVSDDISARFEAYGWQVLACDGHDMRDVDNAISAAKAEQQNLALFVAKRLSAKAPYPVRHQKCMARRWGLRK